MKTGFERALELGADIVVKVDSDGQMDPALIPSSSRRSSRAGRPREGKPLRRPRLRRRDAAVRRAGNLALSFLVKAASGYWSLFDPCNGYLAIRAASCEAIRRERLADRYFFEISLLCESYRAGGVVADVADAPAVRRRDQLA